MDCFTPREVWREYEARKRAIDAQVTLRVRELYRERDEYVGRVAEALGCGVPERSLTEAQRAQQDYAIRRWRETSGWSGT